MNISQILDQQLQQTPYDKKAKKRVRKDAIETCKVNQYLKSMIGLLNYDGADKLLLVLEGNLPIIYKGANFNIPIRIYFPCQYPEYAVIVYVIPNETMALRYPAQFIDRTGKVQCNYLNHWNQKKSKINELIFQLQLDFGQQCPVYSKGNFGYLHQNAQQQQILRNSYSQQMFRQVQQQQQSVQRSSSFEPFQNTYKSLQDSQTRQQLRHKIQEKLKYFKEELNQISAETVSLKDQHQKLFISQQRVVQQINSTYQNCALIQNTIIQIKQQQQALRQ